MSIGGERKDVVVDLNQTLSKECGRELEGRKPRREAGTLYYTRDTASRFDTKSKGMASGM
jgi:hypothetical protein